MANKRIYELTSDIATPIVDDDLIPFDKYVSPGVYTTVHKSADNIKSYITALSTVSFTNIETSINAIIPAYNSDQGIYNISSGSAVVDTTSPAETVTVQNVASSTGTNSYLLVVTIIALSKTVGNTSLGLGGAGVYHVTITNNTIRQTDVISEYQDGNINLTSAFSLISGVLGYDLRFTPTHTYNGDDIDFSATVVSHQYKYVGGLSG